MSCRFQPDYRGDAMFRGVAGLRTEPCLDFTFDIVTGMYIPTPTIPHLIPMDRILSLACGETLTSISLSNTSPHALYRTTNLTTNQGYLARFFTVQLDDVGDYSIELANVLGFTPYITVHRSTTIMWQGVLTNGAFSFSVELGQTGPAILEVSSLSKHEEGSFDVTFNCPGGIEITPDSLYIGLVGVPYRTIASSSPGNDGPTSLGSVFFDTDTGPDADEWVISSGSLPPGISLNTSSGLLSGTPTTIGDYPFVIHAKIGGLTVGTKPFTFRIVSQPHIQDIIAVNHLVEILTGLPPAFFDGSLHCQGVFSDPEASWFWVGKGFTDPSVDPIYTGINYQVNGGLPRVINFQVYISGFFVTYTKSDMTPSVNGTYNLDGGPAPDVPSTLTIA